MYTTKQKKSVSRQIDTYKKQKSRNITNYVSQRFDIPKNYEEHIKGECKDNVLTGGHSKSMMEAKWNSIKKQNLAIIGNQQDSRAFKASWKITEYKATGGNRKRSETTTKKYIGSPKESTFFPNSWDYNTIKREIESVTLTSGSNYGESKSGIMIAKSGNTAYPIVSGR